MKTKDNVQKTIANTMAILFSLVLLSISVNAQSFWKTVFENSVIQPIALAMVNENESSAIQTPTNKTSDSAALVLLEVESEDALEMENWMIDDEIFGVLSFEVEVEEPLELEEWMSSENYFRIPDSDALAEKEVDLEIESWMTDGKIWK